MEKVLVLGASGTVGSALVSELKAKNVEVLRATSQKKTAPDQVHLNLLTKEGFEVLSQVDRLFLLSPPGHTNQDELLIPVIKEAQKAKLKKIVFMSAMGADANPEGPMRKAEVFLEQSGIPYNIIHPNWFMQNFNSYWLHGINQQSQIFLPVEDAKGSFIDARDIAKVAAVLLTSEKWNNQAFDLTGGEALNHHEVANLLSKVTGRKIGYTNITPAEMRAGLLQAGLPAAYAEFMLVILDFFRQGYASQVTDAVEKVTGEKPIRFEAYVQDYKQAWV